MNRGRKGSTEKRTIIFFEGRKFASWTNLIRSCLFKIIKMSNETWYVVLLSTVYM